MPIHSCTYLFDLVLRCLAISDDFSKTVTTSTTITGGNRLACKMFSLYVSERPHFFAFAMNCCLCISDFHGAYTFHYASQKPRRTCLPISALYVRSRAVLPPSVSDNLSKTVTTNTTITGGNRLACKMLSAYVT